MIDEIEIIEENKGSTRQSEQINVLNSNRVSYSNPSVNNRRKTSKMNHKSANLSS